MKSQRITKVITIHPEGKINVCTKSHVNPSIPASQMWGFAALYYCQLNIFGFWTALETKQAILRCHLGLWEILIFFSLFPDILVTKIFIWLIEKNKQLLDLGARTPTKGREMNNKRGMHISFPLVFVFGKLLHNFTSLGFYKRLWFI